MNSLRKVKITIGLLLLITIPVFAIARGFVIELMWRLLLMPIFHTLPDIKIAHAMGLSVFITFFTYYQRAKDKEGETKQAWAFLEGEVWRLALAFIASYIINFYY